MAPSTEHIILSVARKHFVRNGFAATRMQEIADEAGINKALLHYYFRSKDKLFREVVAYTFGSVMPQVAGALGTEGTFWEKLECLVGVYVRILIAHPEVPAFILTELAQRREVILEELGKQAHFFTSVLGFVAEMQAEMDSGRLRQMPPNHLLINVLSMTIFPFVAKPIYSAIFAYSDADFQSLMQERQTVIMDFLRHALRPA